MTKMVKALALDLFIKLFRCMAALRETLYVYLQVSYRIVTISQLRSAITLRNPSDSGGETF